MHHIFETMKSVLILPLLIGTLFLQGCSSENAEFSEQSESFFTEEKQEVTLTSTPIVSEFASTEYEIATSESGSGTSEEALQETEPETTVSTQTNIPNLGPAISAEAEEEAPSKELPPVTPEESPVAEEVPEKEAPADELPPPTEPEEVPQPEPLPDRDGTNLDADTDIDTGTDTDTDTSSGTGTDTDTETGSDTDTDTGSDTDIDTDTDTGSDTDTDHITVQNNRESEYSINTPLSQCNANNPEVFFIDNTSDLTLLNSSSYRIFCIKPGDYRSAGSIKLTRNGNSSQKRELRLYYEDLSDELSIGEIPKNKQALLPPLEFDGADYWIIDRVSITDTPDQTRAIWFRNKSKEIVLNRLYLNNIGIGIYLDHGADNVLVQNSLIGNQKTQYDYVCLALQGNHADDVIIKNVKIIGNEFINCNDAIQTVYNLKNSNYVDFEGLQIIDNDMYITNSIYTDGYGNFTKSGHTACAENAIDMKVGTRKSSNPIKIHKNRMWGYRPADSNCGGGSGRRDIGSAIGIHYLTENVSIKDNIFFDSGRGIGIAASSDPKNPEIVKSFEISGNVFHGFDDKLFDNNQRLGIAIALYGDNVSYININNNIVIDSSYWATNSYTDHTTYTCNVLINAGAEKWWKNTTSEITTDNHYFNTAIHKNDKDPSFYSHVNDAKHDDLCFTITAKSNPTTRCLNDAKPTSSSPHQCAKNVSQLSAL